MSTVIRPEVSEKSEFYISKHRYYELKHFCLQYPEWKRALIDLNYIPERNVGIEGSDTKVSDNTPKIAEKRKFYTDRIDLIDEICKTVDDGLCEYILKGLTEGFSYPALRMQFNIPCCKDTYYKLYRQSFWLLDKRREKI